MLRAAHSYLKYAVCNNLPKYCNLLIAQSAIKIFLRTFCLIVKFLDPENCARSTEVCNFVCNYYNWPNNKLHTLLEK